jgi:hypothetical protein
MPIAPRRRQAELARVKLRLTQLRVLKVLADSEGFLTKVKIAEAAGLSTISATVGEALNSRPVSSHVPRPKPGLLDLGLVTEHDMDIDGATETNYRITSSGREVLQRHIAEKGPLPEVKDRSRSTNKRYQRKGQGGIAAQGEIGR